jgi:hypothetical protein
MQKIKKIKTFTLLFFYAMVLSFFLFFEKHFLQNFMNDFIVTRSPSADFEWLVFAFG